MAPLLELMEVKAGEVIFSMGSPGDRIFVLMHGAVSLHRGTLLLQKLSAEQGQASATATTSKKGLPVFGELAFLDRKPRKATAVADADSKLLVLPHEQFAALALFVPDAKARFRRLRDKEFTAGHRAGRWDAAQ